MLLIGNVLTSYQPVYLFSLTLYIDAFTTRSTAVILLRCNYNNFRVKVETLILF